MARKRNEQWAIQSTVGNELLTATVFLGTQGMAPRVSLNMTDPSPWPLDNIEEVANQLLNLAQDLRGRADG